jgi:uncharacterized phiE125 gp8 family phage protein
VTYRSLNRQTGPAVEPVTLSEAKAHMRVDTSDDDTYITSLIKAAREWCEEYLDRTLVNTQWVMRFDRFPTDGTHDIELPRPPIVSSGTATAVALTFTYENGTTATYGTSSYRVDRASTPGAVKTLYGQTWPPHLQDDNAISVTWWAGYGASGSDVPQSIRHAILMLCSHWYETRGATISSGAVPQDVPLGVRALLGSCKWGSYR